jgi:hypothetical protein
MRHIGLLSLILFAFELVRPDAPIADRTVPPRGMRFPQNYYGTGG